MIDGSDKLDSSLISAHSPYVSCLGTLFRVIFAMREYPLFGRCTLTTWYQPSIKCKEIVEDSWQKP